MDRPLRVLPLLALLFGLAACGNKGPLVRMPDEPPPVRVETEAPVEGATLPDTTPPEQIPATEALEPAAQDPVDEAIPPPPPTDPDGG